jgi:hypothetical protein
LEAKIKMGYTSPGQDISDSVSKILEGIDDFRLVAKNIRDGDVWGTECKEQLIRTERQLFDVEIVLMKLK